MKSSKFNFASNSPKKRRNAGNPISIPTYTFIDDDEDDLQKESDEEEEGKEDLDIDAWMNEMRINAVIPIILARKLKNNLKMGSDKKVVFISSQMGSIDDNYSGRFYFYRSSKSALNSAAKSLSIDWKEDGISVLILHPGWVKTDMGGTSAKLDIPESITQMNNVINELNLDNSGSFLNYEGKKLEW